MECRPLGRRSIGTIFAPPKQRRCKRLQRIPATGRRSARSAMPHPGSSAGACATGWHTATSPWATTRLPRQPCAARRAITPIQPTRATRSAWRWSASRGTRRRCRRCWMPCASLRTMSRRTATPAACCTSSAGMRKPCPTCVARSPRSPELVDAQLQPGPRVARAQAPRRGGRLLCARGGARPARALRAERARVERAVHLRVGAADRTHAGAARAGARRTRAGRAVYHHGGFGLPRRAAAMRGAACTRDARGRRARAALARPAPQPHARLRIAYLSARLPRARHRLPCRAPLRAARPRQLRDHRHLVRAATTAA